MFFHLFLVGTVPCPPKAELALLCAWPFCTLPSNTKKPMEGVAVFSHCKAKITTLLQWKVQMTLQG